MKVGYAMKKKSYNKTMIMWIIWKVLFLIQAGFLLSLSINFVKIININFAGKNVSLYELLSSWIGAAIVTIVVIWFLVEYNVKWFLNSGSHSSIGFSRLVFTVIIIPGHAYIIYILFKSASDGGMSIKSQIIFGTYLALRLTTTIAKSVFERTGYCFLKGIASADEEGSGEYGNHIKVDSGKYKDLKMYIGKLQILNSFQYRSSDWKGDSERTEVNKV